MPSEITDEMIKQKHKEFDDRIKTTLNKLRGKSSNGQPDLKTRIKDMTKFLTGRAS